MVENTEIERSPEKMTLGGEGKGKAIITSTNHAEDEDMTPSPRLPSVRFTSRNSASKYDFVKVKVWLGDHATHYYVLSRFLLSRMLTVTKIPNHVAIKISLELKKLLIDHSLLDVSQSDLEANLFKLMEHQGYGEEYINRYKMMTRFHHQRFPLVILVCGTACVGKSTIATQLAQRLNLPNVFQTDMVYELLRTSTEAPLASSPVWMRNFSSSEELITEFCRECRIVRKGLAGDLKKAIKDGKPIIIEGTHLDPSIYFMDDENKEQATDSEKCNTTNVDPVNEVIQSLESLVMSNIPETKAETFKAPNRKEKSSPRPIIVPIMLKMAEFDHKALLEEWISTRKNSDKSLIQDKDKLEANMKIIQDYLCSFKSRGLTVVNISATTFVQTLDWLHGYLLQCIEQGISPVCSETPSASE